MKRLPPLIAAALGLVAALSWGVFGKTGSPPAVTDPVATLIQRYETDRDDLARFYGPRVLSPDHHKRLATFYDETRASLGNIDFDALPPSSRIDYLLLRQLLEYQKASLVTNQRKLAEIKSLIPFKDDLLALTGSARRRDSLEPREAAEELDRIRNTVAALAPTISLEDDEGKLQTTEVLARRTRKVVGELQRQLEGWFRFYDGFDPQFSWWAKQPCNGLKTELEAYQKLLGSLGSKGPFDNGTALIGDPIGEAALADFLALEMLAYSPAELLAIGEREFSWCRAEMQKAATELGFDQNWRKALEKIKGDFVPPGEQDDLATGIAEQAIAFLEERDLVTVPKLCAETWYLTMLGARQQETLPYAVYFGQAIGIAYPSEEMSLEKKLMSLRGNNRHFTRAVIPHELIPGHHLQRFMAKRHAPHRQLFNTPFYVEGWALHWEMLLYELGYPRTPAEKIGMLFWRAHRCARIIVSLKFHLGKMTPEEMVAFLVDEVGLEESGARSEIRRYIGDVYSPLYQCGYMIGGLQLRTLYHETVGRGTMSPREFHDAVLKLGPIPIEMVRASLLDLPLTPDYRGSWKF